MFGQHVVVVVVIVLVEVVVVVGGGGVVCAVGVVDVGGWCWCWWGGELMMGNAYQVQVLLPAPSKKVLFKG